jgi:hypothetical protein
MYVLRCAWCGGNLGLDSPADDITCLQCGREATPPPPALPLIRKLDAEAAAEIRAAYAHAEATGTTEGFLELMATYFDKSKSAIRHILKGRSFPTASAWLLSAMLEVLDALAT